MIGILRKRTKQGKVTGFKYNNKPYALAQLNRYIAESQLDEDRLTQLESYSGGNHSHLMLQYGSLTDPFFSNAKGDYLLYPGNESTHDFGGDFRQY